MMEEETGYQLWRLWEMTSDLKLEIMREIVSIETKMLSVSFSHHGSIYFASDAVEGAAPARIIDDAPAELKDQVLKTFTIGSAVNRGFWNKECSTMDISRGPVTRERLRYKRGFCAKQHGLKIMPSPKPPGDPLLAYPVQNSPPAHLDLLGKYVQVATFIVDFDKGLTRSTL